MRKNYMKEFINKLRKTNMETFGTDEKLDYRIVHKERIERAKEDKWPLD